MAGADGGGGGIGVPEVAISRTAWSPGWTWCRVAVTPAASCIRAISLTWAGSAKASTVPVAPARAVRPERCR